MDSTPLVTQRIESGERFLGEFQKEYPIAAAYWVNEGGDGWVLYIASEKITDDNFDVAYGEVLRLTDQLQDPWFDPFQIKVVGIDDSLAKKIMKAQEIVSGQSFWTQVAHGGDRSDFYVYALPASVP